MRLPGSSSNAHYSIGTNLVVIDRAENDLDRWATHPIKPLKGTDLDVVQGLIAAKTGLAVEAFAEKTGVSTETFAEVASVFSKAENAVILYGKGMNPGTLKALLDFAAATGAKILSVKGEANSQAAALLGLEKPFQLNGHQAVYLALGDDKPTQRFANKLEGVPFLAVQASYASQITAQADVVLPVEMWAEQQGHFVSVDGHIQKAEAALKPAEDVRSNVAALHAVAGSLGVQVNPNWQEQLCQRTPSVSLE